MIETILIVAMLVIWLFIGGYNLVVAEEISRFAFFCCWFTLLLYIVASSAL